LEARQDPTLAVRSLAGLPETNANSQKFKQGFTRQVVLVTSSDRLNIPPIAHFCDLVRQFTQKPV
jgi:hypothetical protein